MTQSTTFIPRRTEGCEASRLGNEFILLDAGGRVLRGLNPTGARIWELIDGRRTAAEISHRVALEFGASAQGVLEDVLGFLSRLGEAGLLAAAEEEKRR